MKRLRALYMRYCAWSCLTPTHVVSSGSKLGPHERIVRRTWMIRRRVISQLVLFPFMHLRVREGGVRVAVVRVPSRQSGSVPGEVETYLLIVKIRWWMST